MLRLAAAVLLISAVCLPSRAQLPLMPDPNEPTGPIAVIDTSMGRVTCFLYGNLAPVTTANFVALATGSKDWKDPATGQPVHGKPFYDGIAITGAGDAFAAGDRLGDRKGLAGDPFPQERNALKFDRPGRLAMYVAKDQTSSSLFFVTDHANAEIDEAKRGSIFGQCDDASVKVVQSISHLLLSTDNHPTQPVTIDHISIVQPGQPLPPPAPHIPLAEVVPQPTPAPVSSIPSPEPTGPTALIETTQGRFTCRLFEQTPLATNTFIGLAEGTKPWNDPRTKAVMHGHFYDGLHINRVLPDFMVQNQEYPNDDPTNDNETIGIQYAVESIPGLTFDRPGRLAMANAGPDTNDSQFFITEVPRHSLDTHYTIFGQCDEPSVSLARKIANLPRNEHNRPQPPVTITKVSIVRQMQKPSSR
jgi:peptidyl-prolyl cis-trans isomerase A (cyclophilin A)